MDNHVDLKSTYHEIRQKLTSARLSKKLQEQRIDNISNMVIVKHIDELINKFKIDINIIADKNLPPYEYVFSNTINFINIKLSEPDFIMIEPEIRIIIANACVNKLISYMEKSYSLDSLKKIVIQNSFLNGLMQTKNVLRVLLDSDASEQYKSELSEKLHRLNSMITDITKSINSDYDDLYN